MYFWWYPEAYGDRGPLRPQPPAAAAPLTADGRLARSVAEALLCDPEVESGEITIDVQNGVVILEGDVHSDSARAAATRRAWSATGVTDVCDVLGVRPPSGAAVSENRERPMTAARVALITVVVVLWGSLCAAMIGVSLL
ncbi:BON domain-containing protein [Paractinoplanes atraurantiacus]|uniref:BON domain-containing protein n=1 Tax=Paractinoplanes atraurantiacus TaxID=1036182 RepID=A0A285J018_9ACTN|nr:BON domain-containing protein [Actinoplanes atraurantiacus]SNY53558.1 BON domain-containing protein [Actinoplanes atraurantiacus]